jgi:RNA polymerase primary sigma factor
MCEKGKRNVNCEENLSIYLSEINRIPLQSREEETKTARAAAAGSKIARERLVNANLRFVVSVAKKYQGLGLPLEDLINEGNIGLINAADRFDVEKGYHFISYAVWWIRQAILSALCEKSRMIRLPVNRAADLVKIEKAGKMLEKQLSAEEEIKEIAELLCMEESHVTDILDISREMISLDNPVSRNQVSPLKELVEDTRYPAPDIDAERNIMKDDIENVLNTLGKDEADVIRCHYGLGQQAISLKEIGVRYNLSKERIRQIEEKAISRLKNPIRSKKLESYVA